MENAVKGGDASAAENASLRAELVEARRLLSAQQATERQLEEDLRTQLKEAQRAEAEARKVPQLEQGNADLREQLVAAQLALADAERRP